MTTETGPAPVCSFQRILEVATRMRGEPSALVRGFAAASQSESTRRSYAQDMRHFKAWGGKLPSTPEMIAEYIAYAASECGLKATTIEHRLAAIHRMHLELKLKSPTRDQLVRQTMAGIRRSIGGAAPPRRVRALIKDDLLEMLVTVAQQKPLKAARDRAILLLGWASAMRRSELVALTVEDVTRHSGGVTLNIKKSKTDQDGLGQTVFVPKAKSKHRCPVVALDAWLELAGITSGAVFRQVSRYDYLVGNSGLTPQVVAQLVQNAVRAAWGSEAAAQVAAHSLRAGFVTEAAMAGLPANEIMDVTRHTSVATLQVYIRPVEKRRMRSLL